MDALFISYSRSDEAFIQRLAEDLKKVGARAWIDVSGIRSGEDWSDSVQKALDETQVMLLVITPESMTSPNVANEWKYHLDEGKVIFPLLLKPAKVHFQLRRLQYINFYEQDYETAFAQLHSELRRQNVTLDPISDDDSSIELPVQEPLPAYDEPPPQASPTRAAAPEAVSDQGSYAGPAAAPAAAAPSYVAQPVPAQRYTMPPPPAAPAATGLLDQAVSLMQMRNWKVTGYSTNSALLEGWSFGSKVHKRQANYIMYGLAVIFGLIGGVVAAFIASKTYRLYKVAFNLQPDGSLLAQGDLGTYTITYPEEVTSLAQYVEVDRRSMNGLAVWIIPIAVGIIAWTLCYTCYVQTMVSSSGY